jgi:hypothetical protein
MEGNVERECSALGGLFQQIINDMKVSSDNFSYCGKKSCKDLENL